MTITLFPYQEDAVKAIEGCWAEGITRPAVVIATGGGKTTVFSDLIGRHVPRLRKEGKRILVLAHRGELLEQAEERIKLQNPDVWTAIVKGSQGQKTHKFADVVIASIQTLARPRRREAVDRIGMIIVDECHTVGSKSYREVLDHYGAYGDGTTPAVGFTATLTRMDGGLPDIWQAVAYQKKIHALIKGGRLVPPVAHVVKVPGLNLSTVKVTAGDLNMKGVADALEESAAFAVIADQYKRLAGDRAGVVFMPSVATAEKQAAAFTEVGITSECITGAMPMTVRRGVYDRYNSGATQVIVNCNVLIEGWDAPHTSCVVIGRPTLNPGNYIQQVGRGLRLAPGKTDCIVMDLSGASHRHSLAGVNDLESDCESDACDCNCLTCGCGTRCKCKIRDCGCRCIEQHEAVTGCKCQGSDDCPCLCQDEECECSNDAECGCKEEGAPREQKEVDASQLTEMTVMDILGAELDKSRYMWLQTPAGVAFLQIGQDTAAFLMPDPERPGMFFQGVVRGTRKRAPVDRVDGGSVPADVARAGLESLAAAKGVSSSKGAAWRRTKANQTQVALLHRHYGQNIPDNLKKGEASDMLSSARFGISLDWRFGTYVERAGVAPAEMR